MIYVIYKMTQSRSIACTKVVCNVSAPIFNFSYRCCYEKTLWLWKNRSGDFDGYIRLSPWMRKSGHWNATCLNVRKDMRLACTSPVARIGSCSVFKGISVICRCPMNILVPKYGSFTWAPKNKIAIFAKTHVTITLHLNNLRILYPSRKEHRRYLQENNGMRTTGPNAKSRFFF
jgi:hypothetical protein